MAKVSFTLTMSTGGTQAEQIAQGGSSVEMASTMNYIAKALSMTKFRGAVQFIIYKDSVSDWVSEVTFTDDLPTGYWNSVQS